MSDSCKHPNAQKLLNLSNRCGQNASSICKHWNWIWGDVASSYCDTMSCARQFDFDKSLYKASNFHVFTFCCVALRFIMLHYIALPLRGTEFTCFAFCWMALNLHILLHVDMTSSCPALSPFHFPCHTCKHENWQKYTHDMRTNFPLFTMF